MQLPGRLKTTTLGDLLGLTFRARATGTLELAELTGRTHRVHLSQGLVTAVYLDRASASLAELLRRENALDEDTLRRSLLRAMSSRRLHGEVLVNEFRLSPEIVGRALRTQIQLRLHVLEQLKDAQVTFRVTVPTPKGALIGDPLAPTEFLAGRRRARDREATPPPARRYGHPSSLGARESEARRTLGVGIAADTTEIKKAYRDLVRRYHPDLHPAATAEQKRRLALQFAEVTRAYAALVA